jgi:predicted transcriptional regulator
MTPNSYNERSTKPEAFLKLSADCKRILEVLENGPCGYSGLVRKTHIPRGTINRRLKHLKKLGLIRSVKRKWTLVTHIETYRNIQEYQIYLGHSWELVKGILAINEFLPQFQPAFDYFYMGNILTEQRKRLKLRGNSEMWPYTLHHLKTGYPAIFGLFERCVSLLEKVSEVRSAESREALSAKKTLTEPPQTHICSYSRASRGVLEPALNVRIFHKVCVFRAPHKKELSRFVYKTVGGSEPKRWWGCPDLNRGHERPRLIA